MTDRPSDNRQHPRYEVHAYIDYTGKDVLLYHHVQNLSLGGVCIQTPTLESVGTVVDIVINFPDLGKQMSLTGEVVWANNEPPPGSGRPLGEPGWATQSDPARIHRQSSSEPRRKY